MFRPVSEGALSMLHQAACFKVAGAPAGLVNIVPGAREGDRGVRGERRPGEAPAEWAGEGVGAVDAHPAVYPSPGRARAVFQMGRGGR
jgi:hypothetical protein